MVGITRSKVIKGSKPTYLFCVAATQPQVDHVHHPPWRLINPGPCIGIEMCLWISWD